ncbi:hypothetical protein SAMN04487988_111126 [Algoriphagus hitonicola]|uniref:Natural product n=1 Tax=Algoriphagus hitonicola TaxID=435880 RepID=A0A1I2W399_9BACT|nr:hypothetical protein SAMN04487988_111126 [Algoriphagus hitonicola]
MIIFEKLGFSPEDFLQRSQMSTILGGGGSGSGTCGYLDTTGYPVCNLTREQAEGYANQYGGHWCCDSCSTASYCNEESNAPE